MRSRTLASFLGFLVLMAMGTAAPAAESQFGFVYTTDLLPKGEKEIEQWVTWRSRKNGGTYNLIEGRTAYEYGVSDDFQGAIYATYAWTQAFENGPYGATTPAEQFSYDNPQPDAHYQATRFIGVSAEGIYRLMSPYIDSFGLALYGEPTLGPQFFEMDMKLLLQKNYLEDTLVLGFNFTYAPEFRFSPPGPGETDSKWTEETDINLALAASYRFRPSWFAGLEFFNERELNSLGFTHESNSGFYLGPNLHYGGRTFFVTGTLTRQLPLATSHMDTVPGSVVNGYTLDNDFEVYRVRFKVGFFL